MAKLKKIAITGGKGGTGKSTFSILLASNLAKKGKRVVLCDCDVECPNDYLLLGEKLGKFKKNVFAEFPKLDKRKCRKCGICVEKCPNNAIFQAPGEYPIFLRDLCASCGLCWNICPYGAIKPKEEKIGRIYLNKISSQSRLANPKPRSFWLVTGLAKEGLEETGPIVRESKEFALSLTEKIKADYLLLDTAAGTHCPVINALLETDFAFVVTEPTPMGAYDLNLIMELCEKLKVPVEVILNQANLGQRKEVEKVVRKFGGKIVGEIPYSEEIVRAYSQGKLSELNYEAAGFLNLKSRKLGKL